MKNNIFKSLLFWVFLFLFLVGISNIVSQNTISLESPEMTYTNLISHIEKGDVKSIQIQGHALSGEMKDGKRFTSFAPEDSGFVPLLQKHAVEIKAVPVPKEGDSWTDILISFSPMILILAFWFIMMRQMMASNGKALSFGKSKARLMTGKDKVTFADVAGIEEAKQELQEIVDFLKAPTKFQRLGGKIPKGALLVGPPGTGKTLLAKAIAGEADVPFFSISGSDFVEMFVGVGASRVRDMFEQAKKAAPCIVFVDEIDAVGRHRGAGLGGGNDEREQTLNQLLVEMDGFEENSGIIILAATNRPDVLDPALLRPGRFDRQIVVSNPDIRGREQILKVHVKKVPLAPDVKLDVIARGTPGFSGADLANLINEGALMAARRNKTMVTMKDLEDAKDKVMMGSERKSMVMDDEEKRMTAYHEAGHAIVSLHLPESDPLHKVTIIPRGRALGVTMQLPEKDKYSQSKLYLTSRLSILFAGRVAEEMILGKDRVSTGASNDIQVATTIARKMVTEWGFSDTLGPIAYEEPQGEVFLGYDISKRKNMADETALRVDKEIQKIIENAYHTTKEILKKYKSELDILAKGLVDYETLSGDEIQALLKGRKIRQEENKPAIPPRKTVPDTGHAPILQ
ncbi:MAG: ATP-dependent zinc metalloprotease FtsH, partial [Pseudomonadota bacterium]|nr:ATP-dependent zinc metalloprotease FtsH [Pseudomonadota bacterium]